MSDTNYTVEVIEANTPILTNISLYLDQGEIVGIIGPSGAGKSSLLMLLNRLVDIRTGTIFFRGNDLSTYSIIELRRKVGMVFQSSSLFDGTVEDNLKFGPSLIGKWKSEYGPPLLKKVHLPERFLYKDVEKLSGGEKQRVALARTLANDPEVYLFDEITSALDLNTVEVIEQLLIDLAKQQRKTILLVTHNIKQAERICDRLIFMSDGKIIEQGETNSLLHSPKSEKTAEFLKE